MKTRSRRKKWLIRVAVFAAVAAAGYSVLWLLALRSLGQSANAGLEQRPKLVPDDAVATIGKIPVRPVEPVPAPVAAPVAVAPPVATVPVEAKPAPAVIEEPALPEPVAPVEPPPHTQLPLSLIAISPIHPGRYSRAIIADSSARSNAYWL